LRCAFESVAFECVHCERFMCAECGEGVYVRAERSECIRTHFAHYPCAYERECGSGAGGEGAVHASAKAKLQSILMEKEGGVRVRVVACDGLAPGRARRALSGTHRFRPLATHKQLWVERQVVVDIKGGDQVVLEKRQMGTSGRWCVGDVVVLDASGAVRCTFEVKASHATERCRQAEWFELEAKEIEGWTGGAFTCVRHANPTRECRRARHAACEACVAAMRPLVEDGRIIRLKRVALRALFSPVKGRVAARKAERLLEHNRRLEAAMQLMSKAKVPDQEVDVEEREAKRRRVIVEGIRERVRIMRRRELEEERERISAQKRAEAVRHALSDEGRRALALSIARSGSLIQVRKMLAANGVSVRRRKEADLRDALSSLF
jgi:hypothetical protein